MTQAVTVREGTSPAVVHADQVDLIKRTVAKDATNDELQLYFYDCARQGVHPLDKLIHFTKRAGKYVPITGIDFMRMQANGTGAYAGSDDATFKGEPGMKGFESTLTVYRFVQGVRCPFTATARWEEYYPGDTQGHMWKKMPHVMLSKCAEALALRKGYADKLHGLYIREEMDQATEKPAKDTRGLREKLGVAEGHGAVIQNATVKVEPVASKSVPVPMTPHEPTVSEPAAPPGPVKSPLLYPFGQHKGQSITDVPDESLQYWMDRIEKDLQDPKKKNFWAKSRRELEQLQIELHRRVEEALPEPPYDPPDTFATREEFNDHMEPPAEDLTLQ